MQLEYTVHSVVVEKVPVTVSYNDKPMSALVDGLVIELVVENDNRPGHTFRFVPTDEADMQHHLDAYQVGRKFRADFTPVE